MFWNEVRSVGENEEVKRDLLFSAKIVFRSFEADRLGLSGSVKLKDERALLLRSRSFPRAGQHACELTGASRAETPFV